MIYIGAVVVTGGEADPEVPGQASRSRLGRTDSAADDVRLLAITPGLVTQLQLDYRFSLLLEHGDLIVIEEPFALTIDGRTVRVPERDVHEVGAALPLFNRRLIDARVVAGGVLQLRFESGELIEVPVK